MNKWLMIDTDIVSHLMRGGHVADIYMPHLQGKKLAISFVTVGEMYFGAEKAGWGPEKRNILESNLKRFVVVPYNIEVAKQYGIIMAERQKRDRPISDNDAWIASCAITKNVPLVTHNSKEFELISGIIIITEHTKFL